MQVTHRTEKNRLIISIDSAQFYLYDRSVEEIGQAIFQAYQCGMKDAILGLGFKEVVVDAFFDATFDYVEFDFGLPMDLRARDIEEWVILNDGDTTDSDSDSDDG